MESKVFMERAALRWLIGNNIITIEMLDDLRAFLLLCFNRIRRIEIDCDRDNYHMVIYVTMRHIWKWFTRKKSLSDKISYLTQQYLPGYVIEVKFV